ncbi:hypothetical protein [Bacterioplanoides sp.]|uniref:hypothetical protein n=1 Tax=Bacterioplanoides sp. TaxID=2066072 RepID=UPI003AFFC383
MKTSELFNLFGKIIDSGEVNYFFEANPSFKIERPSCGSQYAISNNNGVDLLFEPDDGAQGGKTKNLRKIQSMFLYSEGKDGHEEYKGDIPLGFNFSDTRKDLITKSTPQRTWKIGQGEVDVDFPNPSHDRWEFEGFFISAHYSRKTGQTMYFIITRRKA